MMKVATGLAVGKQASPELAANAVQAAMLKANIHAPSSVLLFLTSEFAADPQSAIVAAAKAASCTQIIGCSATGIFTEEDWVLDSPAAAAMVFSELNFGQPNGGQANGGHPRGHPSGSSDAKHHALPLLLSLAAPSAINATWLNAEQLPALRFGGVSGDATGHGPFSVWQNGKGTTQGYCEVSLSNVNGAVAASHGLKIISPPRRITAAEHNDMITIANLPAFTALRTAWQKHQAVDGDFPYHQLMVVYADKASQLERGEYSLASLIVANEETQSVTLSKALKVGGWMSWAIRDMDSAQVDIVKTTNQLKRQLIDEPDFALLFSCLGRGPYFYNGVDQDLALIKTLLPNLPLIGFYGNGEIAPVNGANELLQYSAVLGLFAKSNISYL
jgi:small ligand-binding sensory domain FIST